MQSLHQNGTKEKLRGKKLAEYIWDYYKLPILIAGIFLCVVSYIVYRNVTDKTPLLYTALVNVTAGETLTMQLSEGFLDAVGADTTDTDASRSEVCLYSDLYLTYDPDSPYNDYTYASQLQLLAAVSGEQLDILLMDRDAFDTLARSGYLCNVGKLLADADPAFYQDAVPFLAENTYTAEEGGGSSPDTGTYPMALDLSQTGLIGQAGYREAVYLGVVANSPRKETATAYLHYLFYGE